MDILRTAGFYVSSVIIKCLVVIVNTTLKIIKFFKKKKKLGEIMDHASLGDLIETLEKGTNIHISITFLDEWGNRKKLRKPCATLPVTILHILLGRSSLFPAALVWQPPSTAIWLIKHPDDKQGSKSRTIGSTQSVLLLSRTSDRPWAA